MALVVLVTIPQRKAKTFVQRLLKQRVCACVNIIRNVESFFWWQGNIEVAKEALLVIKTKNSAFSRLRKIIEANHPYAVPEIVAYKIDKINKKYQDWLYRETRS